ncbi:aminoglycoside phosphotransferase family protein [Saccharopolyspora sp. NPDC047091]|uniref:aminoglycoside phosphotransferase family protein n=1 Tax=Saccharopolyspora sp. NPDC047091 TaxID=3155924 RepID=UPI0033D73023
MAEEEVLAGGNMTAVTRVGNTVRRTAGPWTPAVHALLAHLRRRGFTRAPEPLGRDERGREVLGFLSGAVATYPLAASVLSDHTLREVAGLLREYHDATVDFEPPAGAVWQWPPHEPREVLCHNDFCPYNLLFEDGRITGVIDFDTASPGPRVWDLGYTAYRFVPLTGPRNPDVGHPGVAEQRRRLALFCDAYGLPEITPADVLRIAITRLQDLVEFIVGSARAEDPAQQAVLDRGDTEIYRHDIDHLTATAILD